MTVHVLTGPPCAGKTTFARSQTGTVIDLDDIEEELGGTRYAEHSPVRGHAVQLRRQRIDAALAAFSDEDVWVIHTSPTPDELVEYFTRGATVRRIDPGVDVVLERAAERPPHTVDIIRAWYERHGDSSAPVGGTSTGSPAAHGAPSGASGTSERRDPEMSGTQNSQQSTSEAFKPITTQADLDRIMGDRLARERAKFEGFDDFKTKAEKYDQQQRENQTELQRKEAELADEREKRTALEQQQLRAQIASAKSDPAKGIHVPAELLTGKTKEELEASADKLIAFRTPVTDAENGDGKTKTEPRQRVIVENEGKEPSLADSSGLHALRDQIFGNND